VEHLLRQHPYDDDFPACERASEWQVLKDWWCTVLGIDKNINRPFSELDNTHGVKASYRYLTGVIKRRKFV
jgi:hypothetical protein